MTIDAQIEALDKSAIEYCTYIAAKFATREDMAMYVNDVALGWLMVIGLRKAQLISERKWHGMALVA